MIELKSLVKRFTLGDETIMAVDHVSLTVEKGDFISIVGPSGSGKSTLMNIIGLLDRADEGEYRFDGADVASMSDNEQADIRNRKIGFVFQSFFLLPKLNAVENVMVPLLYRGVPEREARKRAEAILEKMDLGTRMDHLPSELSGGQQQRVAIARALVGEPELILADEPTGALDSRSGKDIVKLLKELNAGGQTIILITHDIGIAGEAKRRFRITDGRIAGEDADTAAEEDADTAAEECEEAAEEVEA